MVVMPSGGRRSVPKGFWLFSALFISLPYYCLSYIFLFPPPSLHHIKYFIYQENDLRMQELGSQVNLLKAMTIDINNEVKSQNKLLDGMGGTFGSATDLFKNTIGKLGIMVSSGRLVCFVCVCVCVCVCLFPLNTPTPLSPSPLISKQLKTHVLHGGLRCLCLFPPLLYDGKEVMG